MRHVRLFSLILGSIILMGGATLAYTTSGLYWESSDIPVDYYIDNVPSSWESAINDADDEWDKVQNNPFAFVENSSSTSRSYVFEGSIDGSGGTVAQVTRYTTTYDFDSDTIDAFDFKFDDSETWSASGTPGANELDVWNVASHEFGHAAGLDHSSNSDATMYDTVAYGETKKRDLHQDDINGLNAIY